VKSELRAVIEDDGTGADIVVEDTTEEARSSANF